MQSQGAIMFQNTVPQFQADLTEWAKSVGITVEAAYLLWREYTATCDMFDQSPVFPEFVDWYTPKVSA